MGDIPETQDSDHEDVVLALEVAKSQWSKGDRTEAIKWLRKAADHAFDAGDDRRGIELSKSAAELNARAQKPPVLPPPPKAPGAVAAAPSAAGTQKSLPKPIVPGTGSTKTGPSKSKPSISVAPPRSMSPAPGRPSAVPPTQSVTRTAPPTARAVPTGSKSHDARKEPTAGGSRLSEPPTRKATKNAALPNRSSVEERPRSTGLKAPEDPRTRTPVAKSADEPRPIAAPLKPSAEDPSRGVRGEERQRSNAKVSRAHSAGLLDDESTSQHPDDALEQSIAGEDLLEADDRTDMMGRKPMLPRRNLDEEDRTREIAISDQRQPTVDQPARGHSDPPFSQERLSDASHADDWPTESISKVTEARMDASREAIQHAAAAQADEDTGNVAVTHAVRVAVARAKDGTVSVRLLDETGLRPREVDAVLVALTTDGDMRSIFR